MELRFSKMHGIGNDFVLLDLRDGSPAPDPASIRAMADRHTGIGFDQLLTIERARDEDGDVAYGIWNADGSPSGQCGNGVRCVAAWLHRDGALALDASVRIVSPSGAVSVRVRSPGMVTVDMGEPVFAPAQVPFIAKADAAHHVVEIDGAPVTLGAVSMGNPHAVVTVDRLDAPDLGRLGPALSAHPRFPAGANAGFVQRQDADHLHLRVHERGSGWTRACGTGACAAMAVLRRRGEVDALVRVTLPGGVLQIAWEGPGHPLWMTGPAAFAFEGRWPMQAAD